MERTNNRGLFVEDFKDIRDLYVHFLSQRGFEVAVASDGQEALQKAVELHPDIVVMDLSLPVIGGWEVIQRLKKDDRTRNIPVILLTAHGIIPDLKNGCAQVLSKPCLPDKLAAEIKRILKEYKSPSSPESD